MTRVLALLLWLTTFSAWGDVVRLALVVGNNAGSGDRPPLRYAENDAGKVARLLIELGDVPAAQLVLLQGQNAQALEQAVGQLKDLGAAARANRPTAKLALLFYFSGHSDGEGLEVGRQLVLFSRLRAQLAVTGAEVRLLIVDACRSGAALQRKGGRPSEAFTIRLTETFDATGEAFIASSAADEAALESNEVMGSIFTHHLVSGLRGAADTSQDQHVTLGEAYRYAYDQTVARTALLFEGTQHPSYDYRLSGQGEWVLTSLVRPSGALMLPPDTERAVITDVVRDQIVAEVPRGVRTVALAPGLYGVRLLKEGVGYGGRVRVTEGPASQLSLEALQLVSMASALARKGSLVTAPAPDWRDQRVVAVTGGIGLSVAQLGAIANLRAGFEPRMGPGLSIAVVGSVTQQAIVSEWSLEARLGWRYAWLVGPVWLAVGAEAGPGWVALTSGEVRSGSLTGVLAPRAGLRLLLGGPFTVSLDGELGLLVGGTPTGPVVRWRPSLTGGVAIRW